MPDSFALLTPGTNGATLKVDSLRHPVSYVRSD